MNKVEDVEIKVEVGLPSGGFRKYMFFNRFHIEREQGFVFVQFGLASSSGLLDSYSCVLSDETLLQNRDRLTAYLGRIGQPSEDRPLPWKGAPVDREVDVIDSISMACADKTAESCLHSLSLIAASKTRREKPGGAALQAQPMALLRSSAELQKQLIISLYNE
jgi:hypothetical protein